MKYDVNKMIQTTICQKCPAKPTKTPLTEFLLSNNLLWVPELLYCPECGNYVTIQVREMTKEELKARDEKTAKAIIEVTGRDVADAILNDPLNTIPIKDDAVIADAAEKHEDAGKPDDEVEDNRTFDEVVIDALPPLSFETDDKTTKEK